MINKDFPVLLKGKEGKLFNGIKGNDQVDVTVIHPITHYENNRPHWLLRVGNRKKHYIDKSKITQYPLLVLAYRKNEIDNKNVPADIIEIFKNETVPSLILDKGNYDIIMKDKDYNIIYKYEIKMD